MFVKSILPTSVGRMLPDDEHLSDSGLYVERFEHPDVGAARVPRNERLERIIYHRRRRAYPLYRFFEEVGFGSGYAVELLLFINYWRFYKCWRCSFSRLCANLNVSRATVRWRPSSEQIHYTLPLGIDRPLVAIIYLRESHWCLAHVNYLSDEQKRLKYIYNYRE